MNNAARSALALLWVAACTADPSLHPRHGCESDAQCQLGERCYRGFCVAGPDAGPQCGAEIACNGEDDDCDGDVDEHAQPVCDTGLLGACGDGVWVCSAGAPSCARSTLPSAETCDGRDEDCDGETDNLPPAQCYPDGEIGCVEDADGWTCAGTCATGTAACSGGALGPCLGAVTPREERCGGTTATDEDCDGGIDEGCECTRDQSCYGGPSGTVGVGACRAGVQSCVEGVLDPACREQVRPSAETCLNPGVDDDCNGVLDDVAREGDPCVEATGVGDCRLGRLACGTESAGPICVPRVPVDETCDGNDEDCDGRIDEAFDRSSDPMNCGTCGNVCDADETCCGGACVDTRASSAHCGACATSGGASCGATQVCCGGTCEDAASCGSCMEDCAAMSRTCCVGSCADTANDERNCGGCGIACAEGQLCCGGACVGSDATHCGQSCSVCASGSELCCSGSCVPVGNDHCNACGVSCGTGDCCSSGCVDLRSSMTNCGACGNACPAGQRCSAGNCCPTGQTWCAAQSACRDLANDSSNCGGCGPAFECGAGSRCCGGTCRLLTIGC